MARNDIKIVSQLSKEFSTKYLVASGTVASIASGTPTVSVLASGTVTGVVKLAQDDAGIIGSTAANDARFTGLAKSDSTETASVAGVVTCWMPLPGLLYSGLAKSAAAADTQAEVDALVLKQVTLDLTTGTWSVDTGKTDAAANAIVITGGDYRSSTIYFVIKPTWSAYGAVTTLT